VQSNLEEISDLDCRLRQTVAETRQIDAQLAQLRTIYRKAIAEFQQLSHETAELSTDLRFLNISLNLQKAILISTDDQCLKVHSNMHRVQEDSVKLQEQINIVDQQLREIQGENALLGSDEFNKLHILCQNELACQSLENEMQRQIESIRWSQNELSKPKRTCEAIPIHERIRLYEDAFRQNSRGWQTLSFTISEHERTLPREIERMHDVIGRVVISQRTGKTAQNLERDLLRARAEAKALEDELHRPLNVHRWMLLEPTDPGVFHLIQLRTIVLDQLYTQLSQTSSLIVRRNSLRIAVKRRARSVVNRDYREQVRAAATQLQAKTEQLATMTREADDHRHRTDAVIAELEATRREVTEEKEQFYITKWKEGANSVRSESRRGCRSSSDRVRGRWWSG
jgi:hypothetical protein